MLEVQESASRAWRWPDFCLDHPAARGARRVPIQRLQSRQGEEQRKLDLVGQLGDLVKTLQTQAEGLQTSTEFLANASSISDENIATTERGATATPEALEVQRTATDRWASTLSARLDDGARGGCSPCTPPTA